MGDLKEYVVYALLSNKECVYVGCTGNLKNRLSFHKTNKVFDSSIIISSHNDKNEALLAERSIIKFLSVFEISKLYNGSYALIFCNAQNKLGKGVT